MIKRLGYKILILFLAIGWIFSGWPQIFNFPPELQMAYAAAVATPVITLAGGSYTGIQTTTITDSTGGATICYTTNGSTPGAATAGTCDSAPTYTYSSTLTINSSQTIKALGTKKNSTNSSVASSAYTITVNTPTFGTNGGSFNNDTSSTILDAFTDATICYTTNGSTPGATTPGTCDSSPTQTYSTAVPITVTGTVLKAIGTKSNATNSAVATSNAFTLTVGAITSSPGAGTYPGTQSVTLNIASTIGATAYYTTNGDAVSCASPTYTGAFNISLTTMVKAIGCKTNYNSDTAISDLYTITVPAAPTGVAATKTLADKVIITWTKSTGATNYHVWRDTTDLGAAGDVNTFDDTGAAAPTITAGTASATDGSANDKVTLSINGASGNNGTSYTYKVIASNATGNSIDSNTDTGYRAPGSLTYQWYRSSGTGDSGYSSLSGATTAPYDDTAAPAPTITAGSASASDGTSASYVSLSVSGQSASVGAVRYYYATVSANGATSQDTNHNDGYIGVGSLTYQWQRSAADSDASYSDISGATTANYNDIGAPADGSGRYYRVVENASSATQQISSVDRGYKIVAIISITVDANSTISYGALTAGASKSTIQLGTRPLVRNSGNVAEDFKINGQNTSCPWTLSTSAGNEQYVHEYSSNGGNSWTPLDTSGNQVLVSNIAVDGTQYADLRVTTPTVTTCYTSQSVNVGITAYQH